MLRVRNLSMCYPNGKLALSDFDLTVEAGELVVVLGGNGSGKTTLLRCVTRTLQPSGGEIWLGEVNLAELSGDKLRRARMRLALISQHASLVRRSSVLTNVATGSLGRHFNLWTALGGVPTAELKAAEGYLGEVGLGQLAGQVNGGNLGFRSRSGLGHRGLGDRAVFDRSRLVQVNLGGATGNSSQSQRGEGNAGHLHGDSSCWVHAR